MLAARKSWAAIKVNLDESRSRKAVAKKFKERYKKACEKERLTPLNKIMTQFEETNLNVQGLMLGPRHAKVLAQVLLKIDYINVVNLSSNCLGDEGVAYIACLIPGNMSISRLNLAENDFGVSGLKSLVSGLSENPFIIKLNISGNHFGDEGAKGIAELLEIRTGIRDLKVSHAEISDKGAVAIGTALAENDTLEALDLSWNHIRGKGAITIANSLKTNKTLKKLNVCWNGFGMEGARAMGQALAENTRLEELDLTNNRIDRNAMALLIVGLKVNSTLHTLKLGKNQFGLEVVKMLLRILEKNEKSALINIDLDDLPVDNEFLEMSSRLSGARNLNVSHGRTVRKIPEKTYEPPPAPQRDPLDMMFEFKYEHGYRTLDLLNRMDMDNNMTISKDELKLGLLQMDVHVDDEQVDDIVARLDTNNDGEIDYGELMEGEKAYGSRNRRHMNMKTMDKIRSMAQAIMKMQIAAKLTEVEKAGKTTTETETAEAGPSSKPTRKGSVNK